ncbi:MAG: DUF1345 domain-containing protein [Acidobacteriaceae bacterium]|nr:DUF1345 domain-containing protein [Acidobacteriaceae bacterium]
MSTVAEPKQRNSGTHQTRAEPRWPALVAILAMAGLHLLLPERLTPGPTWLIVLLILVMLAIAVVSHHAGRSNLNQTAGLVLLMTITVTLIWSLGMLISGLPGKKEGPTELLRSAVALWVSNILLFASWYWRLDAGGPHRRDTRSMHTQGAFLFPQMTLPPALKAGAEAWKPGFVDYLFLAFNTSTAFSPTDVPVLSAWAKILMIIQSCISLGTIAILAARAINIL